MPGSKPITLFVVLALVFSIWLIAPASFGADESQTYTNSGGFSAVVPGEFEIRQSSLGEVFNSNLELEMEIDGKTTELFDDCILITDRLVLVLADNTDVGLGFHYIDFVFVDEFNQTIKKRMALGNSPSLIRVEH